MNRKMKQRNARRGWDSVAAANMKMTAGAVLIAASGALSASAQVAVVAPGGEKTSSAADGQTTSVMHTFDIPEGSLAQVLDAYQTITGVHVQVVVPGDEFAGIQSAGVHGSFSEEIALKIILAQTGLSATTTIEGKVEVGLRNSEQIDVTTSLTSVALQQFPEPLLDTAQTVINVPQFILQDQDAITLRDGLRNIPGISMAAGEGGSQGDTLTIRGFNARNDIYLDGIRDFGSYYRDAFDYESIDVLQGPSGVEFGRGATGGIINQETKEPRLQPVIHANAQFGTDQMRRVTADLNEPLTGMMDHAAFRIDVVGTQSGIAERQIAETRRFGIAPALEFGLGTHTRTLIQYLHESENSTPDYGLPYLGTVVARVNRSNYYGFADDNFLRTNPDVLTGKVEHDLNDHLTLRNILRFANYPRDVRITEPQVNTAANVAVPTSIGAPVIATCAIGATAASSCYALDTPLSQIMVNRNQINVRSTEDMLWDQASATAHFHLFHSAHDLMFLAEGGRERSDPGRNTYAVPYTSLLDPNPYDPFAPTLVTPGVKTHVTSQSFGIGFNDTIKLNAWLQLSGGIRYDYFNTESNTPANAAVTPTTAAVEANRLDRQPTYRAAAIVKPKPNGTLYFDWGTSFDPSAEALSLSANNATAAPEENTTYEIGTKWGYLRDRLEVTGAIFRTEKDNAHETDPNNSLNTLTVGTYIVKGVQFGTIGHLPQHFDIILGYAYLDAYLDNSLLNASPFNAANIALIALGDPRANRGPFFISPNGAPIANVAKNTGNVFFTHNLFKGFVGGIGGNYVAARRASSGTMIGLYETAAPVDVSQISLAPKAVPGYYLYSAMLRHAIAEKVDFQVNLNNLANKFYIDQPHPNHLVPGEGMNAQFEFNFKF